MKYKEILLIAFCVIMFASTIHHSIWSNRKTSLWENCLGRTDYISDARIKVIDKCAVILNQ